MFYNVVFSFQEKSEAQSPNLADSLSDKNSIDSKAANSLFPGEGGGGGRGAEILRIPRPSTTVSLSTVIGMKSLKNR